MNNHFKDKDALSHVLEKRTEGILCTSEEHGIEMPGHLTAGADSAREMAIFVLLVSIFLPTLYVLIPIGLGWFAWKVGNSAWLGWVRLEHLHRLIEQEKYEIEHHRSQEREELVALYGAKGFEGKLLEDVVDVLMADQDRLLKVMLEEEMGLTLETYEHPLKQCVGSALGALISFVLSLLSFFLYPSYGILIASFLLLTASAVTSAIYEKNRVIRAVIWNISIGALCYGVAYLIFQIII